jgi:two-component system, NtrC family, sensor kinase
MTMIRPSVLVIEDDLDLGLLLKRVLSPAFNVALAPDAETALWRFVTGERFDAILCDVSLPRMDGATLVEQLRKIDSSQARRVIVLTANPHSRSAAKLSDHLVLAKPFRAPELREAIGRMSAAADVR